MMRYPAIALLAALFLAGSASAQEAAADAETTAPTVSPAPTAAPTPPIVLGPKPDCFNDTSPIYYYMLQSSSFEDNVYKLCPNMVFNIGFDDDNGICCTRGMKTMYGKSRSTIQCGDNGRLEDNCVIKGGEFHFLNGPQIFDEQITQGMVLRGLTFEDCETTSVIMAQQGDVLFENCIWRVCALRVIALLRASLYNALVLERRVNLRIVLTFCLSHPCFVSVPAHLRFDDILSESQKSSPHAVVLLTTPTSHRKAPPL